MEAIEDKARFWKSKWLGVNQNNGDAAAALKSLRDNALPSAANFT